MQVNDYEKFAIIPSNKGICLVTKYVLYVITKNVLLDEAEKVCRGSDPKWGKKRQKMQDGAFIGFAMLMLLVLIIVFIVAL